MPSIQLKRGAPAAVDAYTGPAGEIVADSQNWNLRLQDGPQRVRAALAAPPEPQPEDKPVDKKSPLRRLLDRLKGPKSEE